MDVQAQVLQKTADRLADALEHLAVNSGGHDQAALEAMAHAHGDDCPACIPVRAEIMKAASEPPTPSVPEEVHEYGKEPEAPENPDEPVEVGQ